MNASMLDVQFKVRIPSAATWIIQGLPGSVPHPLVAAVTAEIVGANTGIGYLIQRSAGNFFTFALFQENRHISESFGNGHNASAGVSAARMAPLGLEGCEDIIGASNGLLEAWGDDGAGEVARSG